MGDPSRLIVLPPGIRAYLADRIGKCWVGEGRDAGPVIEALPESLPAGEVTRLVGAGPFGWGIDGRLDEIDGRFALEVIEEDRMSGPDHYRVWDDGSKEQLATEWTTMMFPANCSPDEEQRIKDRHYAHNHEVQSVLKERGFIRSPE